MRKIAFVNEKGGTCKTTLTVNMGAFFALKRKAKVLLVDMDPQGQVGKSLGINVNAEKRTVYDLLTEKDISPSEVILKTKIEGLDVIVSNKGLIDFSQDVAYDEDRHLKLKKQLDKVRGYDYLIIDSPPSLGLLTLNILTAVNSIIIPVSLTYFALDGCAEIMETVETVRDTLKRPDLRVSMVVPTLYRHTLLAEEILGKLKAHFGEIVTRTVIGYSVRIDEAQSHGQTIWEYDPSSRGAEMLHDLALEIEKL